MCTCTTQCRQCWAAPQPHPPGAQGEPCAGSWMALGISEQLPGRYGNCTSRKRGTEKDKGERTRLCRAAGPLHSSGSFDWHLDCVPTPWPQGRAPKAKVPKGREWAPKPQMTPACPRDASVVRPRKGRWGGGSEERDSDGLWHCPVLGDPPQETFSPAVLGFRLHLRPRGGRAAPPTVGSPLLCALGAPTLCLQCHQGQAGWRWQAGN